MGYRNHAPREGLGKSSERRRGEYVKRSHEVSSMVGSDRGSEPSKISGWIGDSSCLETCIYITKIKKLFIHSLSIRNSCVEI